MHDTAEKLIEKLRTTLPPLLTVRQYCDVRHICVTTAYNDFRTTPGLAVKSGYSTRIVRDVMLDEMARLTAWVPQKDRATKARTTAAKKQARPRRDKQTAAPRREPDQAVRP